MVAIGTILNVVILGCITYKIGNKQRILQEHQNDIQQQQIRIQNEMLLNERRNEFCNLMSLCVQAENLTTDFFSKITHSFLSIGFSSSNIYLNKIEQLKKNIDDTRQKIVIEDRNIAIYIDHDYTFDINPIVHLLEEYSFYLHEVISLFEDYSYDTISNLPYLERKNIIGRISTKMEELCQSNYLYLDDVEKNNWDPKVFGSLQRKFYTDLHVYFSRMENGDNRKCATRLFCCYLEAYDRGVADFDNANQLNILFDTIFSNQQIYDQIKKQIVIKQTPIQC